VAILRARENDLRKIVHQPIIKLIEADPEARAALVAFRKQPLLPGIEKRVRLNPQTSSSTTLSIELHQHLELKFPPYDSDYQVRSARRASSATSSSRRGSGAQRNNLPTT
jgi:hypothetical protein